MEKSRFHQWRKTRPFWGAIIIIVSGLLILWVPFNLYLSTFLPGSIALIGLLFGGLITLLGILAVFFPQSSRLIGILTIFLSILSVIGALGGFLFGTIFGIIGGSLLNAWKLKPASQNRTESAKTSDPSVQIG